MSIVKFKNSPINLAGHLPVIGAKVQNIQFTMNDLTDKSLTDFEHDKLILWFVPSLDTGVCIASAKKLNEHLHHHPSAMALIISCDLPFAQSRVCGLEHLDKVKTASLFRHQETLEKLGIKINEGPLKGLSARCVMLLDRHYHLSYIELVDEITHEPNYTHLYKHLS